MKKYFINIDDSEDSFEINLNGLNELMYNGDVYDYEYQFISEGLLHLRINEKNYTIRIELNEETDSEVKNTQFIIDLNALSHNVSCKNEFDILSEKFSKAKSNKGFKKDLVSPMPGAIVKINVNEGDKVSKGDVLLVLEAMKMENELKAASDATIDKILVEEKKSVDKNDILIKLLPVESQV